MYSILNSLEVILLELEVETRKYLFASRVVRRCNLACQLEVLGGGKKTHNKIWIEFYYALMMKTCNMKK